MYDAETINYYLEWFNNWLGAPAGTLAALARIESGYDPSTGQFNNVCNWLGACGLMQLRPAALADVRNAYNVTVDPRDPIQAIVAATLFFIVNYRYLERARVQNLTWAALVTAYNGGWTAGRFYAANGYAPSAEGRQYVASWSQAVGIA